MFVVGKGGVGKTTTAGALALHLADAGESVHLLSTDPAHSLGDLFEQPLDGRGVTPAHCAPTLALEEFAADAYAAAWLDRLRPDLAELIGQGTYLDAADAAAFMDRSIPGVDEVMAAFRLVELQATTAQHIVVDTAPTGHTLRLLDAPDVLESWTYALQAMADKAATVASALMSMPVRLPAQRLIDDWNDAAERFRTLLRRDSAFVVVTRSGHVVEAETNRLQTELETRGLKTAVLVEVAADAPHPARWTTPPQQPGTGCAALRQTLASLAPPSPRTSPAPSTATSTSTSTSSVPPWLLELPSLLLVAGKGGVGKSTCAAALALGLGETRDVLLLSTDPAGSLGDVLGVEVGAEETRVAARVTARQVDAPAVLEAWRANYRDRLTTILRELGLHDRIALDRVVMERIWQLAPPGIDEVIALSEILDVLPAGAGRTLVIDAAPTGHFLRLIGMPDAALDWAHALMRLLLKYHAVAALEELARDVLEFAKRVKALSQQLKDPGGTGVVLVTLAEPMVEAETARLHEVLGRSTIPVIAMVYNRAGEGPSRAGALHAATPPPLVLRAPVQQPLVGERALRRFLDRWELTA